MFLIAKDDTDLLRALIRASGLEAGGADALKFRADNEEALARLDALERRGFVERRDNRYFLRLPSLSLLPDEAQAVAIRETCSAVFVALRRLYKDKPSAQYPVARIATEAGKQPDETRIALLYLRQAPIWGGYTTDGFDPHASYSPGESILRYKSFEEVCNQLNAWASASQTSLAESLMKRLETRPGERPASRREKRARHSEVPWYSQIPRPMVSLLKEINVGLAQGQRALPSMGLRALFDLACTDTLGDIGTFKEKLKQLVAQGYIASRNEACFSAVLEVGHAATHRGYFPKQTDISLVKDTVEHLLKGLYVLPKTYGPLQARTPKRERSVAKGS